jgi:hypothetical protein
MFGCGQQPPFAEDFPTPEDAEATPQPLERSFAEAYIAAQPEIEMGTGHNEPIAS